MSVLLSPAAAWASKPVVTVASDGSAQYRTVQAAVDAAPEDGGEVIRIQPGTYREKVFVAKNGIEFRGQGKKPEDTLITWDDSAGRAGGTNKSYTLGVTGNDFIATDLTIENNFEKLHGRTEQGSQAVALMVSGDRELFRHVRLLGYQDTLYAQSKTCHNSTDPTDQACQASRQLFEDCYIAGHVDFIFGDSKAVFKDCELHAMQHFEVMLTAQSKVYPLEDSGYLFLNTTVTSDPGVGHISLGRPWRAYARVYFVNTKVVKPAVITPEGWREWSGKLATADYAEYNTGPGDDVSKRLAPSRQLTKDEVKKLTVKNWLPGWDAEAVK
ncbi:MAG: pectinesterase family protein [Acidobacteriaceae bacterium]|nr:pectinesterase family protein [Acidobacteriaceae bacterium]